jgi:hypothetical protein
MARTLLDLVKQATNEISIPEPSQLFGAQDDTSKQLLALAQREAKDFSIMAKSQGGWSALRTDYTFTTVTGQASYALPADFEYFVNRTFWDGSMRWELLGPIDAVEKQILRYGIIANGPRAKFYVKGKTIYINPTPDNDTDVIAFDYYSNAFCTSDMGFDQSLWTADTDTYKLDEDCFVEGIKWRFLRAKGLDYAQEYQDYQDDCQRVMSRDGGARDLPLAGGIYGYRFLNEDNIPDTGFGS